MKKEEWIKAERLLDSTEYEFPLRSRLFRLEPARLMRAAGYEWDHEIRVAIPASYEENDRAYPVLWVLDNDLETALQSTAFAELILVSVGAPRQATLREDLLRRNYDFYSVEDFFPDGPEGDYLRTIPGTRDTRGGGAQRFLDFLIDTVRPALVADYRMGDDHCLAGYSAGATFVAFSLFARPGGFTRYICGSGSFYTLWPWEEQYAANHDDLPAHVFLAVGEREATTHLGWGPLSSMGMLAERLSLRRYPSLNLTLKVFTGETHQTMSGPTLSWGIRSVWGDETLYQLPTSAGDAAASS